jgi:hypothetical protein
MLNRLRKQFYQFRKFGKLPEYWAYGLAKIFDPGRKHRFVIFGQGRTGSTLLLHFLNQHPQIECDNELLQKNFTDPVKYLEGRALMTKKPVYGLKILQWHLFDFLNLDTSKSFIDTLYNKNWHIISVKRKNLFRLTLSNLVAKKRGNFFSNFKDYEKQGAVYIEPEKFKKAIGIVQGFCEDEKRTLKALPYTELIYEDHLFTENQRNKTITGLYQHLGVNPYFQPSVPYIRSTPDDLSDIITNVEELKEIWDYYKPAKHEVS